MQFIVAAYEWLIISRPRLVIAAILVAVGLSGYLGLEFRFDASADSLLLEKDRDLRYYRGILARFGSDDYLVVTYTRDDLFSPESIRELSSLRREILAVPGISTVTTMLDVPLISSPPTSLKELQEEVPNLLSERTDIVLARKELMEGPIYRELIMSRDGRTTAVLAKFARDSEYGSLIDQRDVLREKDPDRKIESRRTSTG